MWICTYAHPPTSTHALYMLFSWKALLTWFTVYAADAVSMVHAVFMEMLVNTEPWKLFGFSYSFHFWCVWDIISISLEQVAFWGQSFRLQGNTFRRLRCRLKRHRTLLQAMYRQVPLQLQMLRNNHEPNLALGQRHTLAGTINAFEGDSLYRGGTWQKKTLMLAVPSAVP